jgi:hypothetical protein
MALSITDMLVNAAPAIISTMASNSALNEASDSFTGSTQRQADTLSQGYDDQLAALQKGYDYLTQLASGQLTDVTNQGNKNVDEYAGLAGDNVSNFEQNITPYFQNYAGQTANNVGNYAENMGNVEQSAEQPLQTYQMSGEEANNYLSNILATDPSQLTPSQLVAYEDAKRQALQTLAASGLRGSGRAGVYAVSNALGNQRAQMEQANRERMDSAAKTLSSSGQSAAGNISNIRTNFGDKVNSTVLNTANDIASKGYALGSNVADKNYTVGTDVAGKNFNQGQQTAQNVADYYGNVSNTEASRNAAVAGTALKKAETNAQNINTQAQTSYANTLTSGGNNAELIGRLASAYAPQIKAQSASKANSNTNNGVVDDGNYLTW